MKYLSQELFLQRANELFGKSTQKEICAKTGLGQSTISDIMNRKAKNQSIDTVCAIAFAYQVTVDWLVGISPVREIETVASERREMCDALGLSDTSIMALQAMRGSPVQRALERMLSAYLTNYEAGEGYTSLLQLISNFLNSITDYSGGNVEMDIDESGNLTIYKYKNFIREENGELIIENPKAVPAKAENTKVQLPSQYANLSFTLAEIKAERQIQEIIECLREEYSLTRTVRGRAKKQSKKGNKNGNNKKAQ